MFFFYICSPQNDYMIKNRKILIPIYAALALMAAACSKFPFFGEDAYSDKRNVMLLYSAGYNSLSSFLKEDISDLTKGWIPESGKDENILLVYSHNRKSGGYETPNPPVLYRMYKNRKGVTVKDTLKTYTKETHSATAEQLNEVLNYVKTAFPAKSYGMIFSSHATGYLPAGYYGNPGQYVFKEKSGMRRRQGKNTHTTNPVPYYAPDFDPSLPAVKSIGQDQIGTSGNYLSYEIELDDFAEAIPMPLEYILFDACLMGGIEVAYELREKCRYVGFSQAEVLAEGFDYSKLAGHLIGTDTPDPKSVCDDYFQQYDIQTGIYHSATISMIDCTKLEPLADLCHILFEKYRTEIDQLDPNKIQRFYRSRYHWFYDMEDIITKAGAAEDELSQLQSALSDCVVYKAATPSFMEAFDINVFSGFSMYLPCHGNEELDKFYQTLAWNKATSLVK